ncbi:MAG: TlpA family protein disulfide reductase [Clostridia bacterium]|nr:MAG: TlpA family protein disulfide reductase [Clostridia bacterium]
MSNKTIFQRSAALLTMLIATFLLVACHQPTPTPPPPSSTPKAATPTIAVATATPKTEQSQKKTATELPLAADFTAEDLLHPGQKIHLSDYSGKIVLLNFWGSWCPPCRAEMPAFEKIYEKYDGKVVVIGVGINDSKGNLIRFAKSIGVTYPIVNDRTSEIARNYHIRSLPTTYRINQKGEIHGVAVGGLSEEQLIQAIEDLLQK